MEPYEIIIAPFDVYLAPVGEAFPAVNSVPSGNWRVLGKNGRKNVDESGVTVTHSQTIEKKKTLGTTGTAKVVRSGEDMKISLTLNDLSLEQYSIALNGMSISEISSSSGVAGQKTLSLHQGTQVKTYAMLIRGVSAYDEAFKAQYQIPVCYQDGNPAPVFNKKDIASLKLEFGVIENPDAATEDERFGWLVMQTASPS
jgi:hypothetical protein